MMYNLCACGSPVYADRLCVECYKHRAAIPTLTEREILSPDEEVIAGLNSRIEVMRHALQHLLETVGESTAAERHDAVQEARRALRGN